MTIRLIAALSLVLTGCIHAPEGTRHLVAPEQNLIEVVMASWSATPGLEPIGESCTEALPRFGINMVDTDEEMFLLSGYCGPTVDDRPSCEARMVGGECRNGCAWSVYRHYADGVWPFAFLERDWPLLVMWEVPNPDHAIVHEALHWLEECTERGVDRTHTDPALWGPEGLQRRLR